MEPGGLISKCGLFVAVQSGHELHVHSLKPSEESSYTTRYDLSKVFSKHRKLDSRALYTANVTILTIEWECVNGAPSTKVALCASDDTLTLVLIFSLADNLPIVIEADNFGIERLQWLPFFSQETSAYTNSTLLAVFTKHNLELRVYSLIHTHVLLTIPMPLTREISVRPNSAGLWSVVSAAYFEKNAPRKAIRDDPSAMWPTLLQFYTDGVLCSHIASLKLGFDPSHDATFAWSFSGKWILYFDTSQSLDAHKLLVSNSLGIHDKPIDDVTSHILQPTRMLDFVPESIETRMVGLYPRSFWGRWKSIDYIVVIPTSTISVLRIRVSDISNMCKSQVYELDMNSAPVFYQTLNHGNKVQYKRLSTIPESTAQVWSKAFTFGESHLVATDKRVVFFESLFEKTLTFRITAVMLVNLALLEAKVLSNGRHILVFTDHVALQSPTGLEILLWSRVPISDSKVIERDEHLSISIVEKGTNNSEWRRLKYRFGNKNSLIPEATFATEETEDSRAGPVFLKASKPGGKLLRRFMYDGSRNFSDSSGVGEEITDTFQTKKRQRL